VEGGWLVASFGITGAIDKLELYTVFYLHWYGRHRLHPGYERKVCALRYKGLRQIVFGLFVRLPIHVGGNPPSSGSLFGSILANKCLTLLIAQTACGLRRIASIAMRSCSGCKVVI
jgi:hypothetical protein